MRLIQAVNSCGRQIRDAFIELDARGTGHIGAEDLQKFSRALPRETLERMVAFAAHAEPSAGVNFREFFELFMESPIYSVDQAINVWHLLMKESDGITETPAMPGAESAADSVPALRGKTFWRP